MAKLRMPVKELDAVKRESVLAAALEQFAERGFHGATVPDIAKRANVGIGTMYRYFKSKEELVNTLYRRWKNEFSVYLMMGFPHESPMREQFHHMWTRMLAFHKEHNLAATFLELHHHGTYIDKYSREVEMGLLQSIREIVVRGQRQKALRQTAPEILMATAFGAFVGLVRAAEQKHLILLPEVIKASEDVVWDSISA
jgi:AcrR family transcriptional regulator